MRTIITLLAVLILIITSCASQSPLCSTPYILYEKDCCLDQDSDETCDIDQEVKPQEQPGPAILPIIKEPSVKPTPLPVTLPEKPKIADDLTLGDENSTVTITVYGDYQDSFTQKFNNEILPKLQEQYGTYIYIVYKDFPHYSHTFAKNAAEAVNCAKEQDKGWEYHNQLFANIGKLGSGHLREHAEVVGLNTQSFNLCLSLNKYQEEVMEDIDEGVKNGVSGTPTFFINDLKIVGYRDFTNFKEILESLLTFQLAQDAGYSKHFSASTVGKANTINLGPTYYDKEAPESPFSNDLDFVTFLLAVDATDEYKEDTHNDKAALSARITYDEFNNFKKTTYYLSFSALKNDNSVLTNTFIHGSTGVGTPYLPKVLARLSIEGYLDIRDEANALIAENQPFHYYIIHGLRENGLLDGTINEKDLEVYLYLPGKISAPSEAFPLPQGFLYLFSEHINVQES